jgi:5-methylcytosine-specific restriction endonuclease McrA
METRICKKCQIEKRIESFPRRSHPCKHLRENVCGMCRKRAVLRRHPEKKRVEDYRRRARAIHVTLAEYLLLRKRRTIRAEWRRQNRPLKIDSIRVRKARIRCPIIQKIVDAERSRDYYRRNAEKARSKVKRWKRNNPAKRSAQHYRERVRWADVPQDLTEQQWQDILAAYGYRCAYCRRRKPLTQDHVIPVSRGGHHTASNIVPACQSCNSSKGARLPRVSYQQHLIS